MPRVTPPKRLRLRRRRGPALATTTGSCVALGVVATMALMSPGYHTQDIHIDNASVWVVSQEKQMLGSANTELSSLSTAVSTKQGSFELIQSPDHLIAHDPSSNALDIYDPAEVKALSTVPLPLGSPRVVPAEDSLLIHNADSGEIWVAPYQDLATFDKDSRPTLSIGVNSVVTADAEGRYLGYSATSHQTIIGNLAGGESQRTEISFTKPGKSPQATLVNGTPVVYDPQAGQVWIDGTIVSVAHIIDKPATALLMQPTLSGDNVLIGFDGGLISISLDQGTVTQLTESSGRPSAPLRLGQCDFAAWSNGTAFRDCGTPITLTLEQASGTIPVIAANGRTVVATEPDSGATWAIQKDGELINNWGDFVDDTQIIEEQEETKDVPPELDQNPQPPTAEDDELGIRAGRTNRLPVLLNDSDPNGDAIVITEFTQPSPGFGTVQLITDDQELQIVTSPQAVGSVEFEYTISDGHGSTDTATVTLSVVSADVNNPPYQARATRTSVASGQTTSTIIIDDWIDPESDPMYLKDASAAEGGIVSFTPEGSVEFTDGGGPGALKRVALMVSDGTDDGSGVLDITVSAVGTVPIIAENFAVRGYVGQEVLIEPLKEARGGTGTLSLNAANRTEGDESLKVTADFAAGTFTASSSRIGTHFIEYSVTDGQQFDVGIVRLEIAEPPQEKLPPVTVPATVFLSVNSTALVDVLAADYDPAGGVLSITGVAPTAKEIAVEVIEQKNLRATLRESLPDGPVTVAYTVTNGFAEATGSLTIVEVPQPSKLQGPIAEPDTVTVRVGSVVDIPVLDNDRHPNGKPITLDPQLVKDTGSGNGTLITSGSILRYLAPEKPGEYNGTYRISSVDGQWATAHVTISVKAVDTANNRPPQPQTITARVITGEEVTIPIPLGSIDPDGDLVTLVSQGDPPQLGAVTRITKTALVYSTANYSGGGTDVFSYVVADELGLTATGTIRVGVVPGASTTAQPLAQDDFVKVRPGTVVSIDPLLNDSDPGRGKLRITEAESTGPTLKASASELSIKVTVPEKLGSYAVRYTIANPAGQTSSAWLHIEVTSDAPLASPIAQDIRLTLADILNRESFDVNVLRQVSFSEGSTKDLELSLPEEMSGVSITAQNSISVAITPRSRIIPFTVSRKDEPAVSSTAFIWVPGVEDSAPELQPKAPKLTVVSGKELVIDINDHFIATQNKKVKIADFSTISATHSNDSKLYRDEYTLLFTSTPDYWGPASITVTVTDGTKQATRNLDITVTPAEEQPAVLQSATLPLEAGGEATLDLLGMTDYQHDVSQLTYSVKKPDTGMVVASIKGHQLVVKATNSAKTGAQARLTVDVRDSAQAGKSGTVTITIVKSTKPTAVAAPDNLTVRRGTSQSVDVLTNDMPTNPFPGDPLSVVSVGSGRLPSGMTLATSADKRIVTVTVAKDATTGAVAIPYVIADKTGDPERMMTGVITVGVQDVPDAPPGAPTITSKDDMEASVVLAIPHAFPNFSDITQYQVLGTNGATLASCGNPDACAVTGLAYGETYQFQARAVNAMGEGELSAASAPVVVDVVPVAPSQVALVPSTADPEGHSMRASWSKEGQVTKGTAIQEFLVTLTGLGVNLSRTVPATETSIELIDAGIAPASSYTVSVKARNRTHLGPEGTAQATAVGPPTITQAFARPERNNTVTVIIEGGNPAGAGGVSYHVALSQGGVTPGASCDVGGFTSNVMPGSSTWTGNWVAGGEYVVQVSNGLHCRMYLSARAPERPRVTSGTAVVTDGQDRALRIDHLAASLADSDHFEYLLRVGGQDITGWTLYPGGIIDAADSYGRNTTVFVRACYGTVEQTCGDPRDAGTVMPLHMKPRAVACFADGTPGSADQPSGNNGTALTIQVRYTITNNLGVPQTPSQWLAVNTAPPVPGSGETLRAEWRTSLGGAQYIDPDPTLCSNP